MRIDGLLKNSNKFHPILNCICDLTDSGSLVRIIKMVQPDEIYNLGAQSNVAVSFEIPEYTSEASGLSALKILESIRTLGLIDKTKYYQASTSELFGKVQETSKRNNSILSEISIRYS